MSRFVYLDNAATTKTHPAVVEEMLPYFTEKYGNPSAIYDFASQSKSGVTAAREQIASLIDISTATVSHHMSMLIEAGFVDIKRESNRIYYIPNKKKIRDFLDELSDALLG